MPYAFCRKERRLFRGLWILLILVLFQQPGFTAELGDETRFSLPDKNNTFSVNGKGGWRDLDGQLSAIEKRMVEKSQTEEQLRLWLKDTNDLSALVGTYVKTLEQQQEQLDSELAALGEAAPGESRVIVEQRKKIQKHKSDLTGELSGYKLLQLHADDLSKKLLAERQRVLTEQFLSRSPGIVEILKADAAMLWRWPEALLRFASQQSGVQTLGLAMLVGLGVLMVAAVVAGAVLREKISRWSQQTAASEYRYASMIIAALGHYAPHLFLASVLAIFVVLVFSGETEPFLVQLGITLPVFFASWAVLHFMFVGRGDGALFELPVRVARGLARSLKTLGFLLYSGFLTFSTDLAQQMSEAEKFIVRDFYVGSVVLVLIWSLRAIRPLMHEKGVRGVHSLIFLVLVGTLIAELLGYRNLSYWILRALFGTGVAFGLFWLLARLVKEFFDGLQSGQIWWQRAIRQVFGYSAGEPIPWLTWMRVIGNLALWLGFVNVLLLIWGASTEALEVLYGYFFNGFLIGSLNVNPARIVVATLMFSALLAISGWVSKRLEEKWLVGSRMDRGSREALVTISGYVGMAIAILVSLSVAGVQFTNLAIIAGALSVGIGFGLQNIVNNFVSGLILLFERPVKTGDWIMVGNTEGYVKRISIRSTLIQTFDRADVIVPNSELISGQVTNWMLYDPRGRVKVPIGVAYGSDTEQVKEILLKIAAEHPKVITDGSMTEPKVLFMGFGESSLDFELRAFIQNIDERLQVVSDINFAIDAAFREHHIEIPFPQRDLHVRSGQKPTDAE